MGSTLNGLFLRVFAALESGFRNFSTVWKTFFHGMETCSFYFQDKKILAISPRHGSMVADSTT